LKATTHLINTKYSAQLAKGNVHFLTIGKKANEYLSKRFSTVNNKYTTLLQAISFNNVKEVAEYAINAYIAGEFDAIEIIYNEFKNVATQEVKIERFLPIDSSNSVSKNSGAGNVSGDYIYEPSVEEILTELVPRYLKTKLYKAVLESNASEHGARMTAMDKATENAGELLKELKISYNRSRQAAITNEILEIVAGADALGG
jgi:F-type H+-transporting ATPase subunit gamma